jgi:catechol 2,3-dioxygenase-like lactoylglutathione lyase family enzyme
MLNTNVPALIDCIDHVVLTVVSVPNSINFYTRVLGMEARMFKTGRYALHFGEQKINLHEIGTVVDPNVRHAKAGSADLCFRTSRPLADVIAHLTVQGVEIIQGPVTATGARTALKSVYFYDPDENLIEVANEV